MDPTRENIVAGYARADSDLTAWLKGATSEALPERAPEPAGPMKNCCSTWSSATWLPVLCFSWSTSSAASLNLWAGRSPVGRALAAFLNAGTRPFDVVNYGGSRAASLVYNRRRMGRKLAKTSASLSRRLDRERERSLSRSMPFPDRWDPFFTPLMTVNDVYAHAAFRLPRQTVEPSSAFGRISHWSHPLDQVTLHSACWLVVFQNAVLSAWFAVQPMKCTRPRRPTPTHAEKHGEIFTLAYSGAAIVGGALLSAVLLSGGGGPKPTYSGMELANLDKGIEALDFG